MKVRRTYQATDDEIQGERHEQTYSILLSQLR
jgi:hypothetical protein